MGLWNPYPPEEGAWASFFTSAFPWTSGALSRLAGEVVVGTRR